ncbi:hypothetical protein K1T35_40715 [Pseudonocardia sp. DSM 110487]|uniref:hypothetical protein n=1 Tax=Pseudonocardia sp. DSM 110487 TaxID=2865833 RepID=UPI001C6A3FCC|nr:hypothetical protein [Pseudonocardia sp. DSM 110487]QYN34645.1 hypothetical protein K1T35_40715 [Pseudonocardia sp. DSM 110487]
MWKLGACVAALVTVVAVGTAGRAEAFEQTGFVTSIWCDDILAVRADGVGFLEIEWREVEEPTMHIYKDDSGPWAFTRHYRELVLYNEQQVVYRVTARDIEQIGREGQLFEQYSYCPYDLPE